LTQNRNYILNNVAIVVCGGRKNAMAMFMKVKPVYFLLEALKEKQKPIINLGLP